MRSLRAFFAALPLLSLAAPSTAHADIAVLKLEDTELDIGGMAQVLGLAQEVNDPYKDHERAYLFLQEARLRVTGHHNDIRFRLEMGLGGEDLVVAPSPGVSLSLLDLSFEVPLFGSQSTYIKFGQFKVPYGREALTYSGQMLFGGRSIDQGAFVVGRDVGVALVTHAGPVMITGGVFTGGGRDIPADHYLPENLGFPLVALRATVGNLEEDPYLLNENAQPLDKARGAFSVNGMVTRDSKVGHSTVLNVKLADKSLLLDANWNPYIARAPLAQGDWWQVGADAVLKVPAGFVQLQAEAQVDWAGYQNTYGVVHMAGARGQFGASHGPLEVAVRYAFLVPDANFSAGGISITGAKWIHEVTPAFTWHIWGDQLKVVADLPMLINVPVFIEKNVGAYVGTELPDETSVLAKGGTVERQNVYEARLMAQAQF